MQDPSNSHAAGEAAHARLKDATAGRGIRGDGGCADAKIC